MKLFVHTIGDEKYTIRIGSNAKDNWNLIDNSYPQDLWIHLDEFPSAHVVISQENNKQEDIIYPNEIILFGCNYCKSYSKHGKNLHKVKIVYTQIMNLKKGKDIGSVIISEPKYITIK